MIGVMFSGMTSPAPPHGPGRRRRTDRPIGSVYRARRGAAFLFWPKALSAFPFVQPAPYPETKFRWALPWRAREGCRFCRSMPAFRAASLRETPSKTDATAKSRRDWFASRTRPVLRRSSSAENSVRVIRRLVSLDVSAATRKRLPGHGVAPWKTGDVRFLNLT